MYSNPFFLPLLALLFLFAEGTIIAQEAITASELEESVSYLASDELMGRQTGTEGIEMAAAYIEERFAEYGIESYRDSLKVGELDAYNIVGLLPGSGENQEEVILLGAHYDHVGIIEAVERDSIANGANDNATGTAAVLALARRLAEEPTRNRTLMFVLFTAEEMGLKGSRHLAQKLKEEATNLHAMLNFEMIGVPLQDRDYLAFATGYDKSNLAEIINDYAGQKLIGESEIAVQYHLFRRSDNFPFYEEFGVPCHTLSSCDMSNFDYYHHVKDETERMDFEFMAELLNALEDPIIRLVNEADTGLSVHP